MPAYYEVICADLRNPKPHTERKIGTLPWETFTPILACQPFYVQQQLLL